MFFKGSRYKDLPGIHTIDAKGQSTRSKTIRRIPGTPGTFLHTVNQKDRPDLLAYKYYGDIKKWWLISDANPDFAMPTDLFHRDPIVQEIFELEHPEGEEKWSQSISLLIKDLKDLRGVTAVQSDMFNAVISVTYNRKELAREEITKVICSPSHGYTIKNASKKERMGQKIIIPPNRVV